MNELLSKLTIADRICKDAHKHYTKAAEMESENSALTAKSKNLKRNIIIVCVVASFLVEGMFGWLGSVLSIGIIIGGVQYYKKSKKEIEDAVVEFNEKINAESAAAQKIFEDNAADLSVLPVDYWYPLAIESLIKLLQSNRADDLRQALNLFDEQAHRWKIEEANSQILQMQQMQTAHLNSIRKSSKVSAVANTASAFANVSKLF